MIAKPTPIEVFLSYATEDEALCLELEKHLGVLKREGLITTWHKGRIGVGEDRDKEVGEHLLTASVIVLLLSANFVASEACYNVEMPWARERQEAKEACVIPVMLRPMDNWSTMPIGSLQALPSNGVPVTGWPDVHAAFADVAQGIRSAVKDGMLPLVVAPPIPLPSVWNVPYPRNVFFTGRELLLQRLAEVLKAGQPTALSQPLAISGLGGIGKTQIAVEYAYQHRQDYQAVLWTLADTRKSLVSGYVAIARLLNLSEKDERDQQITREAVKIWLQTHHSWLLILDNADNLALVREFIPAVLSGHLLLTTRAQSTGSQAHCIEVDTLLPEVGALFLLHRAKLIAVDGRLADVVPSHVVIAHEICEELGGLPLALDQAGAYIEGTHCSLIDYLEMYRMHREVLLRRRGNLGADHPESVATTWLLSFQSVVKKSLEAGELLCLCAFLYPDAISEQLLIEGAMHLGRRLGRVVTDPLSFNEVVEILRSFSLIRRDSNILRLHRLVQAVIRDNMEEGILWRWATRCISLLESVFPAKSSFSSIQEKMEQWDRCEQLVPHVLVIAALASTVLDRSFFPLPKERSVSLFQRAAYHLEERSQYRDAEALYKLALHIREQVSGSQCLPVAILLMRLANLCEGQGRHEEAESYYRSALHVREQVLGLGHPDVASPLFGLAELYKEQGKYEEAEPLYRRALHIWKQTLGPQHSLTLECSHDLAELHRSRLEEQ